MKSALNVNQSSISKQSIYNGLPVTEPSIQQSVQERRASSSHNRMPVVMQAAPSNINLQATITSQSNQQPVREKPTRQNADLP